MKKIPTVFRRDPANMARVLDEVNPGCEWVLAGEGRATRKYDGTCVMFDGAQWWARREVKPGKAQPANYVPIETDSATGKTVGWEPIEQSSFAKAFATVEAVGGVQGMTFELCGPKINGNPEGFDGHVLVPHAYAEPIQIDPADLNWCSLRDVLLDLRSEGIEGIVWHHPDGRMAKLKGRDFPPERETARAGG